MYLGDSAPIGQQIGTAAGSFVAKTGATMLATTLGFGSMAGPIGTVVGGIVSLIASLFGPKIKDPVFGVIAIFPAGKFTISTGQMLSYLKKQILDGGFNWGVKDKTAYVANSKAVKAFLDQSPAGALCIVSGGLPTAHVDAGKLDWQKLLAKTQQLSAPFDSVLSSLTDEARAAVLNEPLPFKQSASYYFQIGEGVQDKMTPPAPGKLGNKWYAGGIPQAYNAVKIDGGQTVMGPINRAFESIPKAINDSFILHTGFDVIHGVVTDQAKADKAFKPVLSTQLASVVGSPMGLILLLGGLYVVTR